MLLFFCSIGTCRIERQDNLFFHAVAVNVEIDHATLNQIVCLRVFLITNFHFKMLVLFYVAYSITFVHTIFRPISEKLFYSYSLNRLNKFLVTLGAWHGESTSTSQEEIENITKHASKDNINSYVSFQRGEDHICGGARMKVDQALTIKPCFDLISQYFWETYAMIPALQVQPYEIGQFKKVNDKFFIIMVSSLSRNLRPKAMFYMSYNYKNFRPDKRSLLNFTQLLKILTGYIN